MRGKAFYHKAWSSSLETKGARSKLLEDRILKVSELYQRLSVRQVYYLLISKYGYSPDRNTYRLMDYHISKLRRFHPDLHVKLVDRTRPYVNADHPSRIELWCEKDTSRNLIEDIAMEHAVPIQIQRGFTSLSTIRDALERSRDRGIEKVLYIGDFDPSGLVIEQVNVRELGMEIERVALTWEQIQRYNLPSRPVNMHDSRSKSYIEKYGTRCWEVESLEPNLFTRIVERALRENVPRRFLRDLRLKRSASRLAGELLGDLVRRVELEILDRLREGAPEDEIIRELSSKLKLEGG